MFSFQFADPAQAAAKGFGGGIGVVVLSGVHSVTYCQTVLNSGEEFTQTPVET